MKWKINWVRFLRFAFYWIAIEGFLMLFLIVISIAEGNHTSRISDEIGDLIISVIFYGFGFPLFLLGRYYHYLDSIRIPGFILLMLINNTIQITFFTGIKRLIVRKNHLNINKQRIFPSSNN
jgi:hypothetical protein